MKNKLDGCKIAILVTDGFEQVEMTEPRQALEQAGAQTVLIAPGKNEVQGMNHDQQGNKFPVDQDLESTKSGEFHALLLPGGVANPDKLRTIPRAVGFAKEFAMAGKPIAAICHGPWLLVEAGLVSNRRLTSWPSLATDIRNAGGYWEDKEVIVDNGLITSRKPDDIPTFNREIIEHFSEAMRQADGHS
jgi:protease I